MYLTPTSKHFSNLRSVFFKIMTVPRVLLVLTLLLIFFPLQEYAMIFARIFFMKSFRSIKLFSFQMMFDCRRFVQYVDFFKTNHIDKYMLKYTMYCRKDIQLVF